MSTSAATTGYHRATTDWTDTEYYLGHTFNTVIGGIDLWLGLQAIVMNMMVTCFYLKSYKKIVPFMYLLIACCDCVTGLAAILSSTVFLLLDKDLDTALAILAPAYSIFSITFKVSVFLNLSISIIRTINIYLPFYRIHKVHVAIATLVYTAGWTGFLIWEMCQWTEPHHTLLVISIYSPGQYHKLAVYNNTPEKECIRTMLFIGLPYLVPSVMVVVCMVLQLRTILRNRPEKTSNSETQRKITITILMLTALFFVCNTVFISYPITNCLNMEDVLGVRKSNDEYRHDYIIRHVTGVLCPFINAAFNPVILIVRGEALSSFLKRKLFSFSSSYRAEGSSLTSASTRRITQCTSIRNPNYKSRPISMISIVENGGSVDGATTPDLGSSLGSPSMVKPILEDPHQAQESKDTSI